MLGGLSHTMETSSTVKLLALAVVMGAGAIYLFANRKPTLEQSIQKLQSEDFHTMRAAQMEILAHGSSALPRLKQACLTSENRFETEICCYLLGEINAEEYASVLLKAAEIGRIEAAWHYPNRPAILSLSETRRKEMEEGLNKHGAKLNPE